VPTGADAGAGGFEEDLVEALAEPGAEELGYRGRDPPGEGEAADQTAMLPARAALEVESLARLGRPVPLGVDVAQHALLVKALELGLQGRDLGGGEELGHRDEAVPAEILKLPGGEESHGASPAALLEAARR